MEGVSFQIVAHWCALMEKPLSQKNGNISRNEDQCFFFFTQRKHDNTWPSKKKKDHSCLKCVKQTSGMRREGESKVWFNSPFSLIGRVGNTYPFCALHWDSGRFMLMNAPDSTIWPLQGNSGAQWMPNSATSHLAPPLQYEKGKSERDDFYKNIQPWQHFWHLKLTWDVAFITSICQILIKCAIKIS